jgi:hypothetical protein
LIERAHADGVAAAHHHRNHHHENGDDGQSRVTP